MNSPKQAIATTLAETIINHKLILLNDDENTFEHIYFSLMEVCGHSPEQAEQCTLIAHNTGKCIVKVGEHEKLRELAYAFSQKMISVLISR